MEKRRDDFLSSAAFSTKMKGKRSMKPAAALQEFDGVRVVRAARGRKDRHSKVCTARGTKDRRVRLSPNTAILFYDVQDRLGYDRPSKAIDWLMKEAKSAIDALDKPPLPTPATNYNHSSATESTTMLKFECGDDEFNPAVSGFGLFNEKAAPPLSSEQFMYTPTPLELFDTNSEMFRLQRILYANAGGEDYSSVSSAAPANFFTEREPLQSSYSRINNNSSQFQGFSFSDGELPGFCGAAIFNEEETMDNSKSSSTASFLHFEE